MIFHQGPQWGSEITPLSLPDAANLRSWHYAGRGLTLGPQLAAAIGSTSPPVLTISGSLNQSIGIYVDIPVGGARGVATYRAFIDGGPPGGTVYQSGTTAASVALGTTGITIAMENATFNTDNVYLGVVDSWDDLSGNSADLASPATLTAKPTVLWQSQNNRPAVRGSGSNGQRLDDLTSSWADDLVGGSDKACSWFMTCRTESAAPSAVRVWCSIANQSGAAPDQGYYVGIRNGTNLYRISKSDDAAAIVNVDGGAIDTDYHVISAIQNGTTVTLREDGVPIFTGSAQDVGALTVDMVSLFHLMKGGTPSNGMVGSIGEILSYMGAYAAPTAVEAYLKARWATP